MSNPVTVKNISIDLRNLDGVVLEEESDNENGGNSSVVDDKHIWDSFFIILSAFAVFIDPLYCYIHVVSADYMCILYDYTLVGKYLILRLVVDVIYMIDIIIFFCDKSKKCEGCRFWGKRTRNRKKVFAWKELIKNGCLLPLSILPRILVALPITSGYILLVSFRRDISYLVPFRRDISYLVPFKRYISYRVLAPNYVMIMIMITPLQYSLRIFLIYGYQRWRPIKETITGRWLKHFLDFLPFILASHLFGALWYLLAVQRQIDCWKPHCVEFKGYQCGSIRDFMCGFDTLENSSTSINSSSRLQELCPTIDANPDVYDFGISLYALQSHVTSSSNLPKRILQSFWWALRNLSSFGSNLSTSMHPGEIFFSIMISISGMALFLVYLNARVQESRAMSNQLILNSKKHSMNPDIDLWLSKNGLKSITKDSKDMTRMRERQQALKMVIIENLAKLEETKSIDVRNVISIIPVKFKRSIIRLLCLPSLKKVPMLASLNGKILRVICEHLKPVIFTEGNCIVQEGNPLGIMLFITQGLAYSYENTNNVNNERTSGMSSTTKWLKRGDFYGEELLNWGFKSPSYSALPFSTRNVVSQTKVEAFVLRASDLKSIVCKFWWHFTKQVKQVDLGLWENLAASSIQATWRNKLARARRSNYWETFTANY